MHFKNNLMPYLNHLVNLKILKLTKIYSFTLNIIKLMFLEKTLLKNQKLERVTIINLVTLLTTNLFIALLLINVLLIALLMVKLLVQKLKKKFKYSLRKIKYIVTIFHHVILMHLRKLLALRLISIELKGKSLKNNIMKSKLYCVYFQIIGLY